MCLTVLNALYISTQHSQPYDVVTIISSIFTDKETENKDIKQFILVVPCEWAWDLNPCSQTLASVLMYTSRNATSVSCVCFTWFNFNSHNSCKRGVSDNWTIFVLCAGLWWWVPQLLWKGQPFTHEGAQWWTNKNHMRKQKFREVSNLPKATHLVTGKGGMWNQAAHLQNNSVSARICMTPLQAAHASPTPSGCYGLIDRGIFIFASFWF